MSTLTFTHDYTIQKDLIPAHARLTRGHFNKHRIQKRLGTPSLLDA